MVSDPSPFTQALYREVHFTAGIESHSLISFHLDWEHRRSPFKTSSPRECHFKTSFEYKLSPMIFFFIPAASFVASISFPPFYRSCNHLVHCSRVPEKKYSITKTKATSFRSYLWYLITIQLCAKQEEGRSKYLDVEKKKNTMKNKHKKSLKWSVACDLND